MGDGLVSLLERDSPAAIVGDTRRFVVRYPRRALALALLVVGIVVFLSLTLTTGPDDRIRADGIESDPDEVLGISNWTVPIQIVCFSAWFLFLVYVIRANSRTRQLHPALVVFVGLAVLGLQDPIQNWAVYAAYDPRLLHFPTDWWYFNTSPTVEPLLPFLLYPIAFGIPALIAMAIYQRLLPRVRPDHFLHRRPLVSLFLVGQAVAIPTTFVTEFIAVHLHIFTFTQLWPPITIFEGTQHQMHIFYEGPFLGALISISAVFLWQDDRGRTCLYRIVDRSPRLQRRPGLAVILLSMGILTTYYAAYGVPYWMMRLTDSSTSVVQTWPLEDTKVYDPQGRMEDAGVPGPYLRGPLTGWPSGQ